MKRHQFISNIFEMKSYRLCLGNFSKSFTVDNMINTGVNKYVS